MAEPDDDRYLDPYRRAVDRFGPGFESTLWGSRATQHRRFDVLIDLVPLEGCRVLDAGCGPGDLAARLLERGIGFASYVGVDAMAAVVEAAGRRELPRCRFVAGDFVADPSLLGLDEPDWVLVSGSLNTMDDPTARRLVETAYERAAQGVAFNFLSDRPHPRWTDRDLAPARRFDTVAWLGWALDLTPGVAFTQDYLDGHDATIVMRHV